MSWFRKNLGLLPAMIDALLQKPDTVSYPFTPVELSENYRGAVEINEENCRGCNMCVRDCPAMALELIRFDRKSFQLIHYPARCTSCGQCEQACPHDAIYLVNHFLEATTDPDDLTRKLVERGSPPPDQDT